MESKNIFLIQNIQQTNQEIKLINKQIEKLEREIEFENQDLKPNLKRLEMKIKENLEEILEIEKEKNNMKKDEFLKEMEILEEKITDFFISIGFDNETQTQSLQMLLQIEKKVEKILSSLSKLPQNRINKSIKFQLSERRRTERILNLEIQKKQQEERNKRALERSKNFQTKQIKKPQMFRTFLIKKNKKEKEIDQEIIKKKKERRIEEEKFLFSQ
ncbi:cilia and flagella associated protein [Anaeramoeba ignava]|uniref:Cilia and flagella associated protein n=1 Tax=Anaeramoeba ignava TaxID=1746090 RepID=A0A9Q0R9B3_ANAIG|nr:cilia and flagella associated protein [Anaeramoeba ignava]